MKKLLERITKRGTETATREAATPQETPAEEVNPAEPKLPPELPLFFMLSHLDDDGPVRLDGVKLGVCEVMGLEIDEPKLGAFAGALNALDFPAQLLIRQHPPRLAGMREKLQQAQPGDLPPQTRAAAESLGRLLTDLEARDGILDRRFYAVCEAARIDDLRGLLSRAGLSVHALKGRQLRMFLVAAALGGSPSEFDEETPVEVEIGRRDMRVGDRLVRSLHLGKWPRSLAPGFLQGLMAAGAPMDLSVHVGPIPAEQAARTLEWQKVRFESAQSLSFKRGRTMSPEAEIALEDITRLRDEVQRGRERLFHASLSVTLHAKDEASLKEMTQRAKAHFGATLGKLDALAFRQREGLLSTLPLALNAVADWRSLDTSSIARLFPFSPPDLDTRSGTLYGIDMRACSPVVYDPWDGTHLNANTAVLARSGSGKSFATKLGVLRGLTRGGVLLVSTSQGTVGRDVAALVGASLLNLVDAVIREQGSVALRERRGALVVVDEMQSMPGVDYESMLSELGKFGASFVLATQSLAKLDDLSRTMRDTLLANVGCLAVFQVAGNDARTLVWELGKERVSEDDIVSLPVHHCYVRATVGKERMPAFSMMVRKPEEGDAATGVRIHRPRTAGRLRRRGGRPEGGGVPQGRRRA